MSGVVRFGGVIVFGVIVAAASYAVAALSDTYLGTAIFSIPDTVRRFAASRDLHILTDSAFAIGLAFAIGAAGAGLWAGYLVRYVLWTAYRGMRLKSLVSRAAANDGFEANFDEVSRKLRQDAIIRHAASQYFNAISDQRAHGGGLRSSVPAGAFINGAAARQHYPLLQIMPTWPGMFVGVGLLLTFVGIVLALYEASAGMGGDATQMTAAVRSLLQVASFKFATSIAGLAVSLVLGFFLKLFGIWIDGAFHRLAAELDRHIVYESPQALSARMARSLDAQVEELKAINNDQFFSRLGAQVAPGVEAALTRAIQPVVTTLQDTTRQIAESSKNATSDAITSIASTVHGAAGQEMRELASTLGEMRAVLERLQSSIAGSGQAAADKLLEAAAEMARELQSSGTRTATDIEGAMGGVLGRIDERFSRLGDMLQAATEAAAAQSSAIGDTTRSLSADMQAQVREASLAAASQLKDGLGEVLGQVRDSLGELKRTALAASEGLERQSTVLGRAADTTVAASATFRDAADDMRRTAEPVRAATREMSEATTQLRGSITEATTSIRTDVAEASRRWTEAQDAARVLASELATQAEKIRGFWDSYERRFSGVDQDLSRAVSTLSEQTQIYHESVRSFVLELDKQFSKTSETLAGVVSELNDRLDDFNEAQRPRAAAE